MKKQKRTKREEVPSVSWLSAMLRVLQSGAVGVVVCVAALALAAALISGGVLEDRYMDRAVIAVCLLGSLIGGLITVRSIRSMPLILGLATGATLFLLLLTAGLLLYPEGRQAQGSGLVACACLCGGGLSGVLGGRQKKKRHR